MNVSTGPDRILGEALAIIGPTELPTGFVDAALERTEAIEQRRPLVPILDPRAWPTRRGMPAAPVLRRAALIAVVVLMAIALLTGVLLVGRSLVSPSYRNVFVRTGPIPGELRSVWPVTMADGRVLVIGGWPGASDNNATRMASILDPATGVFTRTGDMLSEHDNGVPVALADGRILVIAGMHNAADPASGLTPPIADVELYDPATGTFRATASLSSPRYAMGVIRLRDGRVLVAGGAECLGVPEVCPDAVDKVDLYDPGSERFSPTGRLTRPMASIGTALLPDGRVLLVGEAPPDADGQPLPAVADLYDPTTRRAIAAAPTTRPCQAPHVAERREAGPLVVCNHSSRQIEVDARGQPVLRFGTPRYQEVPLAPTVEAYDPSTDGFALVGTLPFTADGAIERLDGKVFVYGRKEGGGTIQGATPWAGLFDPANGTTEFITAPSRVWPLATTLPDGRIVLVSGDDPITGEPMYDAEILE
jgi:hypothetical protein